MNTYESCSRQACYQKKLIQNKCPKCLTIYKDGEASKSVVCTAAIQIDDDIETVTLFTPQVKELMKNNDFTLDQQTSTVEDNILNSLLLAIQEALEKNPIR